MVSSLLETYGVDLDIGRDTTFHEDLGLESIDLVTLASMLEDRYGPEVNLAAFLAELDMDDVIGLRIGMLVDFVASTTSGVRQWA
ncbi:acyl carrier protein [Amycolatopsis suaedae]|uniref:Acyl carrier protein n=2 Tax=Amycolatopsis suaedae TaxID=2510978 RepID=A0A4Q7JEW6_9PSEU|nr:acyl carrier protein [Amycolatopsis suaedae]